MRDRNVAILQALGYLPTGEAAPVEGDSPTAERQAEPTDPLQATRLRAARVHGLPEALADRLQGSSDAAVMLDAQRLARSLQPTVTNAAEVAALDRKSKERADRLRLIHPPRVHEWTPTAASDQQGDVADFDATRKAVEEAERRRLDGKGDGWREVDGE